MPEIYRPLSDCRYETVFDDIHERHPLYRIAIFYVHCSEEVVFERAERRAEVTGRHIPRAVVRESVEATRHSVRALAVKADYVATINNETAVPILEAFETIDRTGRWSLISSRFGYTLPVRVFISVYAVFVSFSAVFVSVYAMFVLKKDSFARITTSSLSRWRHQYSRMRMSTAMI